MSFVPPPAWSSDEFSPSPPLQPRPPHHRHYLPNRSNMIIYNNVPQPNVYQAMCYDNSQIVPTQHMNPNNQRFSSDKKHQRQISNEDAPETSEYENLKDEKRLRRHHKDRKNSGFYEKQSDAGCAKYQPQQQRQNKKFKGKKFLSPAVYIPTSKIRIGRDVPPHEERSMCSFPSGKENILLTSNERSPGLKENASVSLALGLNETQLYNLLIDFIISPDELFSNGYPELDKVKNQVRIWRQCFGRQYKTYQNCSEINTSSDQNSTCEGTSVERICVRCSNQFFVTDHEYLTQQRCCYHWGKIIQSHYTCCKNTPGSEGCTTSKLHVWNGTVAGINEPLEGFVSTKQSNKEKKRKVFALDCEMCYTVKGLELCRVTVLGYNGEIVYDYFVKPDSVVVDYNTRFSGVTERDVNGPSSKTFNEVQSDILNLVTEDTILIGHALDNDLRVLKLVHSKIVDTALVFPHERGFPFRYSLKHLMSIYLKKQIQTSDHGHSPYEDAMSCLQLIILKMKSHYGHKYFNLIKRNYRS